MKNLKINQLIIVGCIIIMVGQLTYHFMLGGNKGTVIEVNNIEELLENYENEYLYFGSSTCNVCKELEPLLKKKAEKYGKNIYYVDIDNYIDNEEFSDIKNELVLYGVPTIYKLEDGKRTERIVIGEINEENMNKIDELLK